MRTKKQLEGVSTAEMTSAEYALTDTPGDYTVIDGSARYVCSGLHSAEVVSRSMPNSYIKKGRWV